MATAYENAVLEAVTIELGIFVDFLSEFGKILDSVYLVESASSTKLVVQIHEMNNTVGDVHWTKSYAIHDPNWDTVSPPRPSAIAAQITTDIAESTFAAGP